jgi:hypothetical protein
VTTTSAIIAIIQDSVIFVDGKTLSKDGIDPTSVYNIFDEEIAGSLMENASMVIVRKVRLELLCTKVDEEFVIPGVVGGDEEEVFIENILIDGGIFGI